MNHQHTLQQLHSLRLTGMAEALSQQLDQPITYEELSFFERLALLVDSESTCRDNRKITRLLKQAKLRLNAHPADIDYRARRGLHKDTLAQLLQLDWIRHHRNLLIEGATGTGKTFLACALGHTACEHGLSVRYYRSSRLLVLWVCYCFCITYNQETKATHMKIQRSIYWSTLQYFATPFGW